MEIGINIPGSVIQDKENLPRASTAGDLQPFALRERTNVTKRSKREISVVPGQTKRTSDDSNESENRATSNSQAGVKSPVLRALKSTSLQDLRSSTPVTCSCNTALCAYLSPSLSTARRLADAQRCERWDNRRNALADPFQMAMPQVTREKLERDIIQRKTSVSKRLSQFFLSKVEPQPETDLT